MTETTRQVFQIDIQAPIQTVWETLTRQGEVLPFFFGSVLHTTSLAPGAPIRMRSPDGKYTGVVGDVLEFEPPHRYSHTFKFTNREDPVCTVTYELEEIEGGTRFTLISDQVPVGTKTEKDMQGGSKIIATTLKSLCETGKPTSMARFIMLMNKLMGWMSPKRCLSENWPLEMSIPLESSHKTQSS